MTNLGVGGHSLTASYSSEGGITGATSGPALESVTQVVLTTHAVRKKPKVILVTLDARVEPVGPGGGTPTGDVALELRVKKRKKFLYRTIAQMPLADGLASLTLKPNQVLKKAVFLSYGGERNSTASTLSPSVLTPNSLARSATAMVASPIVGASHPGAAGHSESVEPPRAVGVGQAGMKAGWRRRSAGCGWGQEGNRPACAPRTSRSFSSAAASTWRTRRRLSPQSRSMSW